MFKYDTFLSITFDDLHAISHPFLRNGYMRLLNSIILTVTHSVEICAFAYKSIKTQYATAKLLYVKRKQN